MSRLATKFVKFAHFLERMKTLKRRAKKSDEQPESIADHCWRLSVLVLLTAEHLDKPVSLLKSLKMAILHDIAESVTGDIPSTETETCSTKKAQKSVRELLAIQTLSKLAPTSFYNEMKAIWEEFELGTSHEAQFVRALDRIEGQLQFNEAGFDTWNRHDIAHAPTRLNSSCEFDSFMSEIANEIQVESKQKIQDNWSKLDANSLHCHE